MCVATAVDFSLFENLSKRKIANLVEGPGSGDGGFVAGRGVGGISSAGHEFSLKNIP